MHTGWSWQAVRAQWIHLIQIQDLATNMNEIRVRKNENFFRKITLTSLVTPNQKNIRIILGIFLLHLLILKTTPMKQSLYSNTLRHTADFKHNWKSNAVWCMHWYYFVCCWFATFVTALDRKIWTFRATIRRCHAGGGVSTSTVIIKTERKRAFRSRTTRVHASWRARP